MSETVCSMCRKPILRGQRYYRCSVSTCNAGRLKFWFCTMACWDAHLPTARHRSAYAIEQIAGREEATPSRPAPGERKR